MTYREKVRKGIAICLSRFHCGEDCPYYNAGKTGCMESLQIDTLALLKEQEPLVIRKKIADEILDDYIAECPECGMVWSMWYSEKMRFCPGCGKAVKWDA